MPKKLSKKLILCGLALIFCIGVVWTFLIYKANRTIDQLKSEDWQVREKAMQSLSKSGKSAVGPLITALKDKDEDIRWRAAHVLGEIKDSRAIEPLAEALKDKDSRVRYRAVEALEQIGDSRAAESLITALKDQDIYIKERTVEAFRKIGKPAIEPLIVALRDEEEGVRIGALRALRYITGTQIKGLALSQDPEKWQKWWEENKDKFTAQQE